MIFTKDNLPDLLEYLAKYMRENPECKEGFGLDEKNDPEWFASTSGLINIQKRIFSGATYRIKPHTRTIEWIEPDSVKPKLGEKYWTMNAFTSSGLHHCSWTGEDGDRHAFKNGLWTNKEHAQHNARIIMPVGGEG